MKLYEIYKTGDIDVFNRYICMKNFTQIEVYECVNTICEDGNIKFMELLLNKKIIDVERLVPYVHICITFNQNDLFIYLVEYLQTNDWNYNDACNNDIDRWITKSIEISHMNSFKYLIFKYYTSQFIHDTEHSRRRNMENRTMRCSNTFHRSGKTSHITSLLTLANENDNIEVIDFILNNFMRDVQYVHNKNFFDSVKSVDVLTLYLRHRVIRTDSNDMMSSICSRGNFDLLKFIVDNDWKLKKNMWQAFRTACCNNHVNIVNYIWNKYGNIISPNSEVMNSAILGCVNCNNTEMVEYLLKLYVHKQDIYKAMLIRAIRYSTSNTMKYIIENYRDHINTDTLTYALKIACNFRNEIDKVKYLLSIGAQLPADLDQNKMSDEMANIIVDYKERNIVRVKKASTHSDV